MAITAFHRSVAAFCRFVVPIYVIFVDYVKMEKNGNGYHLYLNVASVFAVTDPYIKPCVSVSGQCCTLTRVGPEHAFIHKC